MTRDKKYLRLRLAYGSWRFVAFAVFMLGASGPALAATLGFNYFSLGGSTAILSRYPITEGLGQGVNLQLSQTMEAYIFDVHLTAYPYQPTPTL